MKGQVWQGKNRGADVDLVDLDQDPFGQRGRILQVREKGGATSWLLCWPVGSLGFQSATKNEPRVIRPAPSRLPENEASN